MADYAVLKILSLDPGAAFPTYRFWVHLDTSKLAESGLPDSAFVQSFDFGTAPPTEGADSLSGADLNAALVEAVTARKADMVRGGQLEGRSEVTPDQLAKVASVAAPIQAEPPVQAEPPQPAPPA